MNIAPTDAAAVQLARFDEGYNILMGNCRRLKYSVVVAKEFRAASAIADEQLAIDEFVTRDLVSAQKPI